MIATSRVCDVHHKPERPKLTTHLESQLTVLAHFQVERYRKQALPAGYVESSCSMNDHICIYITTHKLQN